MAPVLEIIYENIVSDYVETENIATLNLFQCVFLFEEQEHKIIEKSDNKKRRKSFGKRLIPRILQKSLSGKELFWFGVHIEHFSS